MLRSFRGSKRHIFAVALLAALSGCEGQSLSTTGKGTIGGGVLGAGTGAIVGAAVGRVQHLVPNIRDGHLHGRAGRFDVDAGVMGEQDDAAAGLARGACERRHPRQLDIRVERAVEVATGAFASVLVNWLVIQEAAPRRRRSRREPGTGGRSAKRAPAIVTAGPFFSVHAPAG